jgi:hypothetical protein
MGWGMNERILLGLLISSNEAVVSRHVETTCAGGRDRRRVSFDDRDVLRVFDIVGCSGGIVMVGGRGCVRKGKEFALCRCYLVYKLSWRSDRCCKWAY